MRESKREASSLHKFGSRPIVFLSGVVVLTPGHLRFLSSILSDLTNQTLPFSEIILVSSGFGQEDFDLVVAEVKNYDEKLIQIIRAAPGSAGRNRNTGLDAVSSDAILVMIHDADDRYPYFRNQVIYDQFLSNGFDALLHLYLPTTELGARALLEHLNASPLPKEPIVITPEELFQETFRFGRIREEEALAITDTSLKLPESFNHLLVHHAHVTLQRATTKEFRFHENFFPRNEDGLLVRDLLFSGLKVFVLCLSLSVYLVGASTFSTKSSRYQSVLNWKRIIYSKLVGVKKAVSWSTKNSS